MDATPPESDAERVARILAGLNDDVRAMMTYIITCTSRHVERAPAEAVSTASSATPLGGLLTDALAVSKRLAMLLYQECSLTLEQVYVCVVVEGDSLREFVLRLSLVERSLHREQCSDTN